MTKDELIRSLLRFCGETARDAFQSVIDDEVTAALEDEHVASKNRDNRRAVVALCETKLNDDEIIKVLHKHWNMTHSQAHEAVTRQRRILLPTRALVDYLHELGFTLSDAREFAEENKLSEMLENDHNLSKLKPEDLYTKIKGKK